MLLVTPISPSDSVTRNTFGEEQAYVTYVVVMQWCVPPPSSLTSQYSSQHPHLKKSNTILDRLLLRSCAIRVLLLFVSINADNGGIVFMKRLRAD
jgi:hypothetical protein